MVLRSDILCEARRWIGTPYRHQGSCRGAGCDCLGLVRGVWRAIHGTEPEAPPPYNRDWAEADAHHVKAKSRWRRSSSVLKFDAHLHVSGRLGGDQENA